MGNAKSREHYLTDGTIFYILTQYSNSDYKKCFKKLTKKYPSYNIISAKDDSHEALLKNIHFKKNVIYVHYSDSLGTILNVLFFPNK